jgi:hypothetical protein
LREIGRGGMGVVFLAERSDGEFQQQGRAQTRVAQSRRCGTRAPLSSRTSDSRLA